MDPRASRWLEARGLDIDWEANDGRDDFEEPWNWSFPTVLEDTRADEDSGDDVRRRERMAEAMYEC